MAAGARAYKQSNRSLRRREEAFNMSPPLLCLWARPSQLQTQHFVRTSAYIFTASSFRYMYFSFVIIFIQSLLFPFFLSLPSFSFVLQNGGGRFVFLPFEERPSPCFNETVAASLCSSSVIQIKSGDGKPLVCYLLFPRSPAIKRSLLLATQFAALVT